MPKLFYMQFYTGEWLKDPNLRRCRAATKGIWIDLISTMWEDKQSGKFVGTPEVIGRVCGVSAAEALAAAIDLQKHGVADVYPDLSEDDLHTEITLINRRMKNKNSKKNQNKKSEINITLNISGSESDPEELFKQFYARYPRKEGKDGGKSRFLKILTSAEVWYRLNAALDGYLLKIRDEHTEPRYMLHFSTFMNRWEEYEHYESPSSPTFSFDPPRRKYQDAEEYAARQRAKYEAGE